MSEYERRGPVSALLRGARCLRGPPRPPRDPEAGADGRGDLAGGEVGEGERGGARSVLSLVPEGPAPNALSLFLSTTLGEGGGGERGTFVDVG